MALEYECSHVFTVPIYVKRYGRSSIRGRVGGVFGCGFCYVVRHRGLQSSKCGFGCLWEGVGGWGAGVVRCQE